MGTQSGQAAVAETPVGTPGVSATQAEVKRTPAGAALLRDDVTEAIRAAVFEELATTGYARLSIEAVARRAGVGKTAVYRRWRSKLPMVIEVVSELVSSGILLPDTGSLHEDLRLMIQVVYRLLRHPLAAQIVPDLLAEAARNPEIAGTLALALRESQRESSAALVRRAVARGELPASTDPDLALDLIAGPLYWHLLVTREPVTKDYLERLARSITAALGAS
ncbi:TetR family transcriptional regulator [Streptacidiphilus pinicola]|uniref:TetR family transcriptional regulator n=1 Tax=Streptacidiphilus pinicola TaxID=2219663 RepID=A0A2X0KHT5_9ACTN|nr:TetR/AcrR family transcriptional regulator [Streptacidiphilus pinicola]RAG86629.1 TetR family transcriptional regulator [Streptacidiphilus pinicola]